MRSARVQISLRRIGIARILLLVPFAVLGIRAAHLSVDERGIARGENQTQRVVELAPGRGAIVDSSGAELALSVESPSIYAIPSSIDDVDVAAGKLAPILGWKRQKLADRMHDRQSFFFLARWVTPERAQQVLDLGLAGVGVLDEPRRIYPHRHLGAQHVNDLTAATGGLWSSGARRQDNPGRSQLAGRVRVNRVVAANLEFGAQITQRLHEVVRKGVVVVDDQNHEVVSPARLAQSSAASAAAAF